MNNRWKELAEQAGADFMRRINYNNLEGKEYEEDAGVIFESTESFEKFAELILQDIDNIVNDLYHAMPLEQAAVLLTLDENIKEHFYGVEDESNSTS
mgnify:CR=1 FL=1